MNNKDLDGSTSLSCQLRYAPGATELKNLSILYTFPGNK